MTRPGKNGFEVQGVRPKALGSRKIEKPQTLRLVPRAFLLIGFLLLVILFVAIGPSVSMASSDSPNKPAPVKSITRDAFPKTFSETLYEDIEFQWGGYIKVQGAVSWPDDESVFEPVGTGTYYDGYTEFRLRTRLFFSKCAYLKIHYEAILSGGDTWRKEKELERLFPDFFKESLPFFGGPVEDNRRFLDLTKTIDENDDYILYDRLDRLSLTLLPKWGVICIGRQAVTWGNGLLFNPMDLFNPFSPTDIERDYKIGDDMVFVLFPVKRIGDLQFLYVPRRDPSSGDVEWNDSSLAAKLHFVSGTTEFDVMAARHYEDFVIGLGSTGYLGDAAWRMDATWTFLHEDGGSDGFVCLVANMDYSWVWWEKNFYGFIEFYFNGLGEDEYTEAYTDPDVIDRLARGELFTLGRTYLSGDVEVELHPLVRVCLTVINNMADPSGILQPRVVWDMAQDVRITLGGNICYGAKGTEYGGFKIPGTDLFNKPPDSAYVWLTWFF